MKDWQKFEKQSAAVLGTKLTLYSGRLDTKGDSCDDRLIHEAKKHAFVTKDGRLYTIVRAEWFKTLVENAIKSALMPVLSVSLGEAQLYFVPEDFLEDVVVKGKINQGRSQVSIHVEDLDLVYYHTVDFAGYRWVCLPRAEMRDIG